LDVFLGQRPLLEAGKTADLVLIEQDQKRMDSLQHEMGKALHAASPLPQTLRPPRYECEDHTQVLLPVLRELGAMDRPVFAFLDSWGGPDVPLETARAIAAAPASEVFVTFGTNYLIRFGDTTDDRREDGDHVFGGTAWREVFKLPPKQKKSFLVSVYRQSLKDAGFPYVTSFEMLDENTHPLHLVHGTSHPSGLEKMKNAMWTVDRIAGRQFRDPRDPGQGMLEIKEPDFSSLRRALLDKLAEGPQTVAQLQHYALHETVYRSQHVWPLVRELLRAELLERAVPGHLSNDTLLRLASPRPIQDGLF
jgi:three-Cys-motif partner protein